MDAFEDIVASLFSHNGFWVRQGYKVNLTKEEKAEIGKPTMPRLEIDILAYSPGGNAHGETPPYSNFLVEENTLLWVECKSYLDSPGIKMDPTSHAIGIRVFDNNQFRTIATQRLIKQVTSDGLTLENPYVGYCLVAGNIHSSAETEDNNLADYFRSNGWILNDKNWTREKLEKLTGLGYENDVAIIVTKLLERKR